MAISRSLMNRQLQADGGIMQVAPREKFGLGSSIKKFVRKIIPNEVADIAVKAAPFVAPFNPAVAAAMAGLGTFDQTGSIGQSLKGAGMNYAGGQAARYLGGANFQDPSLSVFTPSGFTSGFSSPLGNQTGFKLGKPVQEVQGIGDNTIIPKQKPTNLLSEQMSEVSLSPSGSVVTSDSILTSPSGSGSAMDSFKSIISFDTSAGEKTNAALDLLKKGSKAIFYDKDGDLDKAAVMGALTAATSYAEALALANDAGIELTEDEYNEALKDEKKEEYAGYLQNFFGGKKDGGRIGFESGANEMIKTQLLEEIMPETTTEDFIIIMTEDGPVRVKKSDYDSMPGMFRDTTTGEGSNMFTRIEEADGGRVSRKFGSPKEGESEIGIMAIDVEAGDDEDEEDMMMAYSDAIFNRREKAALFRSLGDPRIRQTTKSFKNLDNILKHPGMFPEDEFMLKEYLKLKGFKDGGRIGYRGGAGVRPEDRVNNYLGYRPEDVNEKLGIRQDGTRLFNPFGRIGLKGGSGSSNRVAQLILERDYLLSKDEDVSYIDAELESFGYKMRSEGGVMDVKMPTGKMRKNNAGVVERDYRDEGGFVPVGIKERADDVPAMLSKNEFVMTADAVRGIGNGSVEEGSKKLYNTMKQAEKVGKA